MYLFVFVDDNVVCGINEKIVDKVIKSLGDEFHMRDLGNLGLFVEIQVRNTSQGLNLSQPNI